MRWRRSDAGRRVKLTDIVSRDVSVLTVEGAHNQIPDMGRRRDSQVANMEHVQKVRKCVQLWKALRSRKLMALLRSGGRSDDLRATRGPASVVETIRERLQTRCDHLKLRGHVQQSSSRQTFRLHYSEVIPTTWALSFLKVDMGCLWLLCGTQGGLSS
jgi:hypothetical protein